MEVGTTMRRQLQDTTAVHHRLTVVQWVTEVIQSAMRKVVTPMEHLTTQHQHLIMVQLQNTTTHLRQRQDITMHLRQDTTQGLHIHTIQVQDMFHAHATTVQHQSTTDTSTAAHVYSTSTRFHITHGEASTIATYHLTDMKRS